MWDLPRPGLEPVSPALAGGFLTTAPPGKPPLFDFLHSWQCSMNMCISCCHLVGRSLSNHFLKSDFDVGAKVVWAKCWLPEEPRRIFWFEAVETQFKMAQRKKKRMYGSVTEKTQGNSSCQPGAGVAHVPPCDVMKWTHHPGSSSLMAGAAAWGAWGTRRQGSTQLRTCPGQ